MAENNKVRVAFLHIEPELGNVEANKKLIERGILLAAEKDATWIVTPEMGTSGYFFEELIGTDWIEAQPDAGMKQILVICRQYGLTVFLATVERDAESGKLHNSTFVLGPEGEILGWHRKVNIHQDHTAENFFGTGNPDEIRPVRCDGVNAGVIICADSWTTHCADVLKERGAQLLVCPSAWPPEPCGREGCWEKRSKGTGLPIWVCNRTGEEQMLDFTKAESIVAVKGERKLCATTDTSAILFFDWDMAKMEALSDKFDVFYF
jgi:predicted amidohydrolase